MADLIVANKSLGEVGLDLVRFGHGRWSYRVVSVGGREVYEHCEAEPQPKKRAERSARRFGRACYYSREYGYVA